MRLTLRFLALFLLLAMATFPNLRSMTAMADEGIVIEEEQKNPCLEGCARGDEICRGKCKLNAECLQKCDAEMLNCNDGCK